MNLQELAAKVSAAHPAAPQTLVTQLLRTTLKTLRGEIESAGEGPLNINGLGVFRVKNVETEKDGQKSIVRRTTFVIPAARAVSEKSADADVAASPVAASSTRSSRK